MSRTADPGTGAGTRAAPVARAPRAMVPVELPAVADPAERVFSATAAPGAAPPATRRSPLAGRVGLDWVSWAMTSLVLTAFFVLVVSGRVVTEGPVLVVLSATHGIHEGDLFALAAACGGIALPLVRGLRRRR